MNAADHDRELLGAYVLGVLEADEQRAVDEHLAGCAECRQELTELDEMKAFLGEVPPEAFLEGPPEGGDLLLQRTLRAARPPQSRRGLLTAAAAVVIAAASVGAGVVIGQRTADPIALPTISTPPTGQKTASATDPRTGTAMTATLTPAAGWVRVHIDVKGLPAGAQCELRVTDRTGKSFVAGSWLVSEKAAKEGTKLDAAALVPITNVKSVDVVTFQGTRMVSVPV